MTSSFSRGWKRAIACAVVLAGAAAVTGCQVSTNGQTLPSPYYIYDDVQYFPPGPKFKLAEEANLMKAYHADQSQQRR